MNPKLADAGLSDLLALLALEIDRQGDESQSEDSLLAQHLRDGWCDTGVGCTAHPSDKQNHVQIGHCVSNFTDGRLWMKPCGMGIKGQGLAIAHQYLAVSLGLMQ